MFRDFLKNEEGFTMTQLRNIYITLISPLRNLALREGTMPNDDMVMTRVVKRILMVPTQHAGE